MSSTSWAVLLAGGNGTRLLPLTRRICGDDRPKQLCPLLQKKTLLAQARERITPIFAPEKICFSVVESHRGF